MKIQLVHFDDADYDLLLRARVEDKLLDIDQWDSTFYFTKQSSLIWFLCYFSCMKNEEINQ